jgi:hypothetical protein
MPLLAPALLTMVASQLLDLATFVTMVRRLGPHAEANPLVHAMLISGGLSTVLLAKLALVVLVGAVAVVLLATRNSWHRAGGVLLAIAIGAGILGGWTNLLTITAA